jgi:hypothetical protein
MSKHARYRVGKPVYDIVDSGRRVRMLFMREEEPPPRL